jgi:hypothetical protein
MLQCQLRFHYRRHLCWLFLLRLNHRLQLLNHKRLRLYHHHRHRHDLQKNL